MHSLSFDLDNEVPKECFDGVNVGDEVEFSNVRLKATARHESDEDHYSSSSSITLKVVGFDHGGKTYELTEKVVKDEPKSEPYLPKRAAFVIAKAK